MRISKEVENRIRSRLGPERAECVLNRLRESVYIKTIRFYEDYDTYNHFIRRDKDVPLDFINHGNMKRKIEAD